VDQLCDIRDLVANCKKLMKTTATPGHGLRYA